MPQDLSEELIRHLRRPCEGNVQTRPWKGSSARKDQDIDKIQLNISVGDIVPLRKVQMDFHVHRNVVTPVQRLTSYVTMLHNT